MSNFSKPNTGGGGFRGPGGRDGGRGRRRGPGESGDGQSDGKDGVELSEKVVFINRSSKVVKGGRRFSFAALVVIGDKNGQVGFGTGKAGEVPEAIGKASRAAKKASHTMELKEGRTIPHEVIGKFGAAKVVMKPAAAGTGVIAGGAVRAILESVGIRDILTKCVGTRNPHNAVRATLDGLRQLKNQK